MIRLWKLGDHKNGIYPSKEHVDKLITILEQDEKDVLTDLVWDSAIEVTIIHDDGRITKE